MYALFAGDSYYPRGGWSDLVGVFDTVELAQEAYAKGWTFDDVTGEFDWGHVVDLSSKQVVTRCN